MDKQQLRKLTMIRLASIPEQALREAGRCMEETVLSSAWFRQAESIFSYVSVNREPSTRRILHEALLEGKRVYVPRCVDRQRMRAVRIWSMEDLAPGKLGIPEPREERETALAEELNLMIVPCICAARDGSRLGHGAGYYDRFLEKNRDNTLCLCYEELLRDDIPMTPLDVWMHRVLTEKDADAV